MKRRNSSPILVLGQALHGPWNEGGRVIARNTALSAATVRPVETVSLSRAAFRSQDSGGLATEHIYTSADGMLGDYLALPRVLRHVGVMERYRHFSAVHLFGLPLFVAAWLRQRGLRTVVHVTLTRQVYQNRVERLRAAAAWRVYDRWIDAYACSSEPVRGALLEQGYDAAKLHVVPPPIDTQCFQVASRRDARRELGFEDDAFVVAYVGTVSPLRFPAPSILQALHAAAATIPKLRLAVYAPVKTHAYNIAWAEENVRQAASEAEVPVDVQLQDLTEAQKTRVYSAADVVLLPFQAPVAVEPPLTLLEAMACRTPVLVTPFANRSGIVQDWANGATYDSPAALCERLQTVYAMSGQQRAAIGRAERQTIVSDYSFAAAARELQHVWSAIGI